MWDKYYQPYLWLRKLKAKEVSLLPPKHHIIHLRQVLSQGEVWGNWNGKQTSATGTLEAEQINNFSWLELDLEQGTKQSSAYRLQDPRDGRLIPPK